MTLLFDAQVLARGFDLALVVEPGETLAILGPNGAGKSTLLGLVAGLVRPDSGSARLDDLVLFDQSGTTHTWTPPYRRGVALLAQEALLFPHLTVLENVEFGPRSTGASRREARVTAEGWLADVDASDLAGRRPGQLSGGQAQRVAAARALAADPRLLLLDEPMSALDISAAPALRRLLKRVLADRTALLVTHDPLDALVLADRVIVIDHGHVVEQGPTREVFAHPRTPFTADLAGLNLLVGVRSAAGLITGDGWEVAVSGAEAVAVGTPVATVVRPAAVRVLRASPAVPRPNAFAERIVDLEPRGDVIRIRGAHLAADVAPAVAADLDLAPGDRAWFTFDPSDADAYPL